MNFVPMFWKEQRQQGVWRTGARPPPGIVPCGTPGEATTNVLVATATTVLSSKRGSQGWQLPAPAPAANGSLHLVFRTALSHRQGVGDPASKPATRLPVALRL